jgi:hypothetical protein
VEYCSPSNVIKAWCRELGFSFGIKHMPRFSIHWQRLSFGKDFMKISMVISYVETYLSWICLSIFFFKWSGIEFPHVYFLNGIWDFHWRLLHFDYHNGLWLDLIVKKKDHAIIFKTKQLMLWFLWMPCIQIIWKIMQLTIVSCYPRKSFHQQVGNNNQMWICKCLYHLPNQH